MKTAFEYINFVDQTPENRKTKIYACVNSRYKSLLGHVKWEGGWRQYVFIPAFVSNGEIIFSAGCLADIQIFIKSLMDARK